MHSNFILNILTVYQQNKWSCNPSNDFTVKNCLLGTVKLTRNVIKSRLIYNGQGIAFDGAGSWSFGNDFARYIVIFGVDNTLSSHTNNHKNNFDVR